MYFVLAPDLLNSARHQPAEHDMSRAPAHHVFPFLLSTSRIMQAISSLLKLNYAVSVLAVTKSPSPNDPLSAHEWMLEGGVIVALPGPRKAKEGSSIARVDQLTQSVGEICTRSDSIRSWLEA